jgi:serine/alanine adding enzyme
LEGKRRIREKFISFWNLIQGGDPVAVISVIRSLDEKDWRAFVQENPAGNIFHLPEMYQVYAHTKGYKPILWAAVKGNRPIGLLLLTQIKMMRGPFSRLTNRAIGPGSVLCAPDPEGKKALSVLLDAYRRDVRPAPIFTELRNLIDLSDIRSEMEEHKFIHEDHLNFLIDLNRAPEQIFRNIGRRTRKHIRRELRKGNTVVEEITNRKSLGVFYDLLKKSYSAARVPLADISLFESAFDILCPRNMAKFYMVMVDHRYAACSLELIYKDRIYGWYSGMNRKLSKYNPNELLIWHILQWGAINGYRVYDFGGAGNPREKYGVRDFKAKFGGELVCYGRNICLHSPWLFHLGKWGYKLFRSLKIGCVF